MKSKETKIHYYIDSRPICGTVAEVIKITSNPLLVTCETCKRNIKPKNPIIHLYSGRYPSQKISACYYTDVEMSSDINEVTCKECIRNHKIFHKEKEHKENIHFRECGRYSYLYCGDLPVSQQKSTDNEDMVTCDICKKKIKKLRVHLANELDVSYSLCNILSFRKTTENVSECTCKNCLRIHEKKNKIVCEKQLGLDEKIIHFRHHGSQGLFDCEGKYINVNESTIIECHVTCEKCKEIIKRNEIHLIGKVGNCYSLCNSFPYRHLTENVSECTCKNCLKIHKKSKR